MSLAGSYLREKFENDVLSILNTIIQSHVNFNCYFFYVTNRSDHLAHKEFFEENLSTPNLALNRNASFDTLPPQLRTNFIFEKFLWLAVFDDFSSVSEGQF